MKCCVMEGGVVLYDRCVCVYAFSVFVVGKWISDRNGKGQKRIGSENAVWHPDDGRKDTRNMLRNYWLPIKSLIVASSWSHLYLLIRNAVSITGAQITVLPRNRWSNSHKMYEVNKCVQSKKLVQYLDIKFLLQNSNTCKINRTLSLCTSLHF